MFEDLIVSTSWMKPGARIYNNIDIIRPHVSNQNSLPYVSHTIRLGNPTALTSHRPRIKNRWLVPPITLQSPVPPWRQETRITAERTAQINNTNPTLNSAKQ